MDSVGIAIAGFAHPYAYEYAKSLSETSEARLLAVWDDDRTRGREAAQRFRSTYVAEYESVIRNRDVEAVVVSSRLSTTVELAELAAEAGKNVLCEVPFALNLEDADRVLKAVRKSGVRFQSCFAARYSPAAVMGREALHRREIGDMIAMTGSVRLVAPEEDQLEDVGAALAGDTLHLTDLMRWYSGSEVESVYAVAVGGLDVKPRRQPGFLAMARFRSCAFASIDGVRCLPDSSLAGERLTLELLGTDGLIMLDVFSQAISVCSRGASQGLLRRHLWGCDVRKEMVRSFLACVRQGLEPKADAFDGRQATEVAIAAYRSARERRPVRLPMNP